MTEKTYKYTMAVGTAGGPVTVDGTVTCEFHDALHESAADAFFKLTRGAANFGNPGVGGCRGPYDITRVVIEQVKQ